MLTTWSQNWTRPSGGGGGNLVIGGTARAGQTITVTDTTGFPCFVQVMYPGTEAYDQPWLDIDLDNPLPTFTLAEQHLGMMVRVVAMELDGNGLPTGLIAQTSNAIGPVLHATDPNLEPGAVVVSTPAELSTAVSGPAPVIVLAAGTVWNAADIPNTISNKRITTPQNNPARISDSYMALTGWTNVTWEGIPHWFSFGFLTTVTRSSALNLGPTSTGCSIISQRVIAPNIEPAVYQNVPANLLSSIYRGGFGMRFTVVGTAVSSSPGATVKGYFARNVYIALDINQDTVCEHVRVHGWYFDCVRLIGNAPAGGGRLVGLYVSHCYGVYDEMDTTANSFGSGNAPHCDLVQAFNGSSFDFTIDKVAYVIGNTRAHADGCTATGNPVNTNFISNTNVRRMRIRRSLFGGSGAITGYFSLADYVLDFISQWSPGLSRGSTGTLRFNEGSSGYENDGMMSRSLLANPVGTQNLDDSAFITTEDTDTSVSGAPSTRVFGSSAVRPDTLGHFALMMRPRPTFATQGAIADTGHMRVLGAIPSPPAVTLTPTAGGFNVSLGAVAGAEQYRIWYRPQGLTGEWLRVAQIGTTFSATDLGGGIVYDVRASVRTPNGWSPWSTVSTVTTGAAFTPDFPASNNPANITRTAYVTGAATTDWTPFTNVSIPAGAMAVVVASCPASVLSLGALDTAWTSVISHANGTQIRTRALSWFNNTGSAVNRSLQLTTSAARHMAAVLLIIPRTTAGANMGVISSVGTDNSSTTFSTATVRPPTPREMLVMSVVGYRGSGTMSIATVPTDYTIETNGQQTPAIPGTTASGIAVAERFLFEVAENPANFTVAGGTTANAGFTLAVYEVAP